MENPKQEIAEVILKLTEGSPDEQRDTFDTYFLPDGGFVHPFCRVPRFSQVLVPFIGYINSRWIIWVIYRWYKILSPRIIADIQGNAAFEVDGQIQILYVEIQQIFSIFFVPFYEANVHLTCKLTLDYNAKDRKYMIASQEDLYQPNEFLKFVLPGGATLAWIWQLIASGFCILGALFFVPITWLEQKYADRKQDRSKKY
ncbi:hypothetical protein BJ878DRAFT_15994 [Calycina marina]|uniref:SigF-like NTF2-like domain-containing protein n=1 Tax=Calycina marina TaxID=1763456 RepID=A0A9P7ZAS5_9HELO|nr:hypothetical protein BJ878DRAFT_15994 [Calycina marina]